MICRAVLPDELDTMLSIMAEAFDLPFDAARTIFRNDPYFDLQNKRVLVVEGKIVSCLTLVETVQWIGSALVPVAGIASVATRRKERRRGYAAHLLTQTLGILRRDTENPHRPAYGFTALHPFSYPYYEQFGWQQSSVQFILRLHPDAMTRYTERPSIRPAERTDIPLLSEMYDAWSSQLTGRVFRDRKRWQYLLDYVRNVVLTKNETGETDGYALYDWQRKPDGEYYLRILECVARSDEGRRTWQSYFAQQANGHPLEYVASLRDIQESGLLDGAAYPPTPAPVIESQPGLMMRVVDISLALESLLPNLRESGIPRDFLCVMDDTHRPYSAARAAFVRVQGDIEIAPLYEETDVVFTKATQEGVPILRGDVKGWSAVLSGYQSLADALSLNSLTGEGDLEGILALFPRRYPFLPTADLF